MLWPGPSFPERPKTFRTAGGGAAMLCHSSEDGLQECSSLALLSFIGSMYVFVYRPPTAHGVANFSVSLAF